MAETTVAAELLYVEDPIFMVVVIAFVFVFIARNDNGWVVGAGVLAVVTSTVFVVVMWWMLTDYPLTYRDGDRPNSAMQGTGPYETWDLPAGASVGTTFEVRGAVDAETLSGEIRLDYGCPQARVRWRLYVDDTLVESGTLREDQDLDLADVALRTGRAPSALTLAAARVDSADCKTAFIWRDPGFEGPGHGGFRVVFPLPGD